MMDNLIELAKQAYGQAYNRETNIDFHIQATKNLINGWKINRFNLSNEEVLAIVMLEGFGYNLIQNAAFGNEYTTPFTDRLIELLDSALDKIPKTTQKVLYRQDSYYYDMPEIGQIIHIKGYWTTSIEDFDNTNDKKWIITPLSPEKTKAHDIYKVYNHGDNCIYPEWQVEYERNSKFKVHQIVQHDTFVEIFVSECH